MAATVPPVITLLAVARYGGTVPFWDEWDLTPLMARLHQGTPPTVAELWAPHNEHRIVLPRLLLLGLGWLTGWNLRAELFLNVAVAALTLLLLWRLVVLTVAPVAPRLAPWLGVVASALTFSLAQWENWMSGFQVALFLNALGVVLAAWALARWPGRWVGMAVAFAGVVVASFSFILGLLLIGLVPLALLSRPAPPGRTTGLAGLLASAGIGWLFFHGYPPLSGHPNLHYPFREPLDYAVYILAFLGAPLAADQTVLAVGYGALALLLLGVSLLLLRRADPDARPRLGPWLLLVAYAGLSGAATGAGRASIGLWQATSSRYATLGLLGWTGIVVLGALAVRRARGGARWRGRRLLFPTAVAAAVVAAGFVHAHVGGRAQIKHRHALLKHAEPCVAAYSAAPGDCLATLYPWPEAVRENVATMKTRGLGPFAPRQPLAPLSTYRRRDGRGAEGAGRLETAPTSIFPELPLPAVTAHLRAAFARGLTEPPLGLAFVRAFAVAGLRTPSVAEAQAFVEGAEIFSPGQVRGYLAALLAAQLIPAPPEREPAARRAIAALWRTGDARLTLDGWAVDRDRGRPADGVLVVVDGEVVGVAPVHRDRPDVAARLGREFRRSGWSYRLPAFLAVAARRIEAFAVVDGGAGIAPLEGSWSGHPDPQHRPAG